MPDGHDELASPPRGSVSEVASLFLKLGLLSFGGPAAHIALMREEVVRRRKWVTEQQFLDLLGATNLIPGPNSTEMAIHLGLARAGWRGLLAGGSLFILPAMVIVLAMAWLYTTAGSTPQAGWVLYGIKPVVIAIVAYALYGLTRIAVKGPLTAALGAAALALALLGVNELALLFGGALALILIKNAKLLWTKLQGTTLFSGFPLALGGSGLLDSLSSSAVPFSLTMLFLTFLKIGAVLYGGGYVLLAFLRGDFVERLGWLGDQQLLDAVAIGQITPGPLFTTATFIGYLLGGLPGGLLATLAIFLPSFFFVAAIYPLVPRLRRSPLTNAFLDGVNVVALGLMAAVSWSLALSAIVDAPTAALALLAIILLVRFRVNSAWLILGGGAVGVAGKLLFG